MRLSADIVMSGEKFNPEDVMKKTGCSFSTYHKKGDWNKRFKRKELIGCAELSSKENDSSLNEFLSEFKKIIALGEKKIGIEEKDIRIYIESPKNLVSIETKMFEEIERYLGRIK